ncbi:MAG: hypothetical protein AAF908_09805 [Pseudomonadota bacterium]
MLGILFLLGAVPFAIFSLPILAANFKMLALVATGLTAAIGAMAMLQLGQSSGSALADATTATVLMGFMLAALVGTLTRALALLARGRAWQLVRSPWIETVGAFLALTPLFLVLFGGDF